MKFLVLFIFISFCPSAMATQQIEEVLDLGGVRFDIDEFPLESHPDYASLVKKVGSGMCSAAWRGYKSIWVIANDELYLSYVIKDPCGDDSEYLDPAELMGKKDSKIVARWYTGTITFRISRKSYFDKSVDGVSGEKYEAVVYQVQSGKVLSRNIEQVEFLWQ